MSLREEIIQAIREVALMHGKWPAAYAPEAIADAILALPALSRALATEEFGWLIETGDHQFWNGKRANADGFTHDANDAVRFARFQDSERIIYWLMESYKVFLVSRQHKWIDNKERQVMQDQPGRDNETHNAQPRQVTGGSPLALKTTAEEHKQNMETAEAIVRRTLGTHVRRSHELIGAIFQALNAKDNDAHTLTAALAERDAEIEELKHVLNCTQMELTAAEEAYELHKQERERAEARATALRAFLCRARPRSSAFSVWRLHGLWGAQYRRMQAHKP